MPGTISYYIAPTGGGRAERENVELTCALAEQADGPRTPGHPQATGECGTAAELQALRLPPEFGPGALVRSLYKVMTGLSAGDRMGMPPRRSGFTWGFGNMISGKWVATGNLHAGSLAAVRRGLAEPTRWSEECSPCARRPRVASREPLFASDMVGPDKSARPSRPILPHISSGK